MSPYKERSAARVAQGLCGQCGLEPLKSKNLGSECLEKAKTRAAAQRAKRKEAGNCIEPGCLNEATSGGRCDNCRRKQADAAHSRRTKRVADGKCVQDGCLNTPKEGCVLCQVCIDARTEVSLKHYRAKKGTGKCQYPGCDSLPDTDKKFCEEHLRYFRNYRRQLKIEVVNAYGGPKCSMPGCACTDIDVLEVDHVGGGGRRHLKKEKLSSGNSFYLWLKRNNFPPGFRILCPTCNKKAHVILREFAKEVPAI